MYPPPHMTLMYSPPHMTCLPCAMSRTSFTPYIALHQELVKEYGDDPICIVSPDAGGVCVCAYVCVRVCLCLCVYVCGVGRAKPGGAPPGAGGAPPGTPGVSGGRSWRRAPPGYEIKTISFFSPFIFFSCSFLGVGRAKEFLEALTTLHVNNISLAITVKHRSGPGLIEGVCVCVCVYVCVCVCVCVCV
jgi:hypothetical protein